MLPASHCVLAGTVCLKPRASLYDAGFPLRLGAALESVLSHTPRL